MMHILSSEALLSCIVDVSFIVVFWHVFLKCDSLTILLALAGEMVEQGIEQAMALCGRCKPLAFFFVEFGHN